MIRLRWTLIPAVALGWLAHCGPCTSVSAQSIWDKRTPLMESLYHDMKARRVGDLLTILINEGTEVANQDRRALSKKTDSEAGSDFSYGGSGAAGSFTAGLDGNSARNFNGSASFSSAREFSDRFSVVVLDVLPNGNMLVAGKRTVVVEGDKKQLTLTGTIRPWDIRSDNSVFSQQVAEMKIQLEGEGVEESTINQGWLNRKLNRLWPF